MRITPNVFRLAFTAMLGLALLPSAAQMSAAQDQQGQGKVKQFGPRASKAGQPSLPPPEIIATHGAWTVQCEAPPPNAQAIEGQEQGKKQCGMVQSTKSEKNPKVGLSVVIVKAKQADKVATMMRVMAPIAVFLPTGVAMEIDGAAVGRVPFNRCFPQVCMAFAEANPDTLAKLKKGNAATFIIYEAPGLGLPMKISLEGFSAALGELDNL